MISYVRIIWIIELSQITIQTLFWLFWRRTLIFVRKKIEKMTFWNILANNLFFFGTRSRLKVSKYKRPRSKPVSHLEFPRKITKNRYFWWLGCQIHQKGEERRAPLLYSGLQKIGKIIVFLKTAKSINID